MVCVHPNGLLHGMRAHLTDGSVLDADDGVHRQTGFWASSTDDTEIVCVRVVLLSVVCVVIVHRLECKLPWRVQSQTVPFRAVRPSIRIPCACARSS